MYTSLGTCDILVRHAWKLGENSGLSTQIERHVHKSRSMCNTLLHFHMPEKHAQWCGRLSTYAHAPTLVHMLLHFCTCSYTRAHAPTHVHLFLPFCTCSSTCAHALTLVPMLLHFCTCSYTCAHAPTLLHIFLHFCRFSYTCAYVLTLVHMLLHLYMSYYTCDVQMQKRIKACNGREMPCTTSV